MKNNCYINGLACISAQPTFVDGAFLEEIRSYAKVVFPAEEPDYKKHIKSANRRRMSKIVKMAIAASARALEEAEVENPDAIIVGTGMGSRQDTETFLENMLENDGQFLAPTKFINSTHNTVAGQIALQRNCNAPNFTYAQNAASFESALVDAQLSVHDDAQNILVGGVDEIAENAIKLYKLNGHLKQENHIENLNVLNSKTPGSLGSEGAAFFVLSGKKTESTYAELMDVMIWNSATAKEMEENIHCFLKKNGLCVKDVGVVVLGNNGDAGFDSIYHYHQKNIFKNTAQLAYKHLVGEFNTASAIAMWMGTKLLKTGEIPEITRMNKAAVSPKILLLYNQYRNREHSLILLQKC